MLIGMSTSCFFGKEVVENSIDVMAEDGRKVHRDLFKHDERV